MKKDSALGRLFIWKISSFCILDKPLTGNGNFEYAATRTSSSWISLSAGKKVKAVLMAGYLRNLGADSDFMDNGLRYWFFSKDGGDFKNLAQAVRLAPSVSWNIGKFTLGLEYEVTAAQFGDSLGADGKVMKAGASLPGGGCASRYWVANHRIQLMTKFNF